MPSASLALHPDFTLAQVDPRIFGSFVEHLGRCVYGGIYEPGHPCADRHGFRTDVLALVRELQTPMVRYPGGNFVSGYNWQDGVGPKESRPRRIEAAWRSIETNQFGTNEFMDWCASAGAEPMMAVNLGTGTPETAAQLVEYCNHPEGTHWSDLRIAHGWKKPHLIKTWCLGNEMDGPWQICHKTADEYGRIATEAAKLMRLVDPSIELVACGSSHPTMPTFVEWDQTVLSHLYDHVEHISLHCYFNNFDDKRDKFLANSAVMERQIQALVSVCDLVKARKKGTKDIHLSFDEWNVWYHSREADQKVAPWSVSPGLLEDVYTLEDALLVGCCLITLLRHADRIKIACIAQLVNVIAPILTRDGGPCYRQTIFYPFRDASQHGRGTVLQGQLRSDTYEAEGVGTTPWLEAVAIAGNGELTLLAVNRHFTEPLSLKLDARSFNKLRFLAHSVLTADDPKARNTFEAPEAVVPVSCTGKPIEENGIVTITLPKFSWNVVRFSSAM